MGEGGLIYNAATSWVYKQFHPRVTIYYDSVTAIGIHRHAGETYKNLHH